MSDINDTLKSVLDLQTATMKPELPHSGTHPYIVTPPNHSVFSLEKFIFNDHAPNPERVKATPIFIDVESFAEYWEQFSDGNSKIFGNRDAVCFTAILDYHEAGEGKPRWGQHVSTLQLRKSEEWKVWLSKNAVVMDQATMSAWIEDNSVDITEPTGATMLEIASTLEASSSATFESAIRLQDGATRFKYTEQVDGKAGATGGLQIPKGFVLTIPIYEGMAPVQIYARFRYRINAGKLTMWYDLLRPAAEERAAFAAVTEAIREKCGAVLMGKP